LQGGGVVWSLDFPRFRFPEQNAPSDQLPKPVTGTAAWLLFWLSRPPIWAWQGYESLCLSSIHPSWHQTQLGRHQHRVDQQGPLPTPNHDFVVTS
jgi:hypothetical protein